MMRANHQLYKKQYQIALLVSKLQQELSAKQQNEDNSGKKKLDYLLSSIFPKADYFDTIKKDVSHKIAHINSQDHIFVAIIQLIDKLKFEVAPDINFINTEILNQKIEQIEPLQTNNYIKPETVVTPSQLPITTPQQPQIDIELLNMAISLISCELKEIRTSILAQKEQFKLLDMQSFVSNFNTLNVSFSQKLQIQPEMSSIQQKNFVLQEENFSLKKKLEEFERKQSAQIEDKLQEIEEQMSKSAAPEDVQNNRILQVVNEIKVKNCKFEQLNQDYQQLLIENNQLKLQQYENLQSIQNLSKHQNLLMNLNNEIVHLQQENNILKVEVNIKQDQIIQLGGVCE